MFKIISSKQWELLNDSLDEIKRDNEVLSSRNERLVSKLTAFNKKYEQALIKKDTHWGSKVESASRNFDKVVGNLTSDQAMTTLFSKLMHKAANNPKLLKHWITKLENLEKDLVS